MRAVRPSRHRRPARAGFAVFGAALALIAGLLAACGPAAVRIADAWTPGLAPGAVFRDCTDCPALVVIPPGQFLMGSPPGEDGRFRQEGPQRTVVIARAFALGRTEITRGQWERFAADTGYATGTGCFVWNGGRMAPDPAASWRHPGYAQGDDHPVVCINRDDAQAYARWLGRKTGKTYRLPSEEEWEYAARAGTQTSRHWSDAPGDACTYANVADATGAAVHPSWIAHPCADGYVNTAPAGSLRANRFGLHDMAGNVWEWTDGCWSETLGENADGKGRDCGQRVLRGGSWLSMPAFARSATRHRLDHELRFSEIGFRLVRQSGS